MTLGNTTLPEILQDLIYCIIKLVVVYDRQHAKWAHNRRRKHVYLKHQVFIFYRIQLRGLHEDVMGEHKKTQQNKVCACVFNT